MEFVRPLLAKFVRVAASRAGEGIRASVVAGGIMRRSPSVPVSKDQKPDVGGPLIGLDRGPWGSVKIIEPIVCVQAAASPPIIGGAMHAVGAALGDEVNLRAYKATVLTGVCTY
jgi:hypothetical protein